MLTLPISLDISSIRSIHLALRVLQTGGQVHTYTTTIGGGYILRIHEVSAFLQHVFVKSLRIQRNSYSHCTKVEKHSHLGRGHGSDRNQRGSWDLSARHTHPPCCPHIHCPPIRERNPCFWRYLRLTALLGSYIFTMNPLRLILSEVCWFMTRMVSTRVGTYIPAYDSPL